MADNDIDPRITALRAKLAERDAKVADWQKVTAHDTPENCRAGIKQLYDRWQSAEREAAELRKALEDISAEAEYGFVRVDVFAQIRRMAEEAIAARPPQDASSE